MPVLTLSQLRGALTAFPERLDQAEEADMPTVTIREIDQRLRTLPAAKLAVVYDFVCFLAEREATVADEPAAGTMTASEAALARDWSRAEEDEAWAHL